MLRRFPRNISQDAATQHIRYEQILETILRRPTISCNCGVTVIFYIETHYEFIKFTKLGHYNCTVL